MTTNTINAELDRVQRKTKFAKNIFRVAVAATGVVLGFMAVQAYEHYKK